MNLAQEMAALKKELKHLGDVFLCIWFRDHDYVIPVGLHSNTSPYCVRCGHKLWRLPHD